MLIKKIEATNSYSISIFQQENCSISPLIVLSSNYPFKWSIVKEALLYYWSIIVLSIFEYLCGKK